MLDADRTVRDLRIALRRLIREPAYSMIVVASLALGIGLCSTAFSIVNGIMLRPLPYENASELVQVWTAVDEPYYDRMTVTAAAFEAWRRDGNDIGRVAAHNVWDPILSGAAGAERLTGQRVSPEFFELLGVAPAIGGGLLPDHTEPGNHRVVLLGHDFWRSRFGGDRSIIGRSITLNDEQHVVIGVVPRDFRHPDPHRPRAHADVFGPLVLASGFADPDVPFLRVVARPNPGITHHAVETRLAGILDEAALTRTTAGAVVGVHAVGLRDEFFRTTRRPALVLLAATVLVLLIIAANLGNLLLVRAQTRGRDTAIRKALGASLGDRLRPLLAENAILAAAGAAAGGFVVFGAGEVLQSIAGRYLPVLADVRPDASVLLFAIGLAVLLLMGMALVPSLADRRTEIRSLLAGEARAPGATRTAGSRVRRGLAVTEIALAVALAIGTALLTRTFLNLNAVDPGFGGPALAVEVMAPSGRYPEQGQVSSFIREVEDQLAALPGAGAVGRTSDLPLVGQDRSWRIAPAGGDPDRPTGWDAEFEIVGPGYFGAMGIPLVAGRDFGDADVTGSPVVIVNERLARLIGQGGRVLEEPVLLPDAPPGESARVVAIVGNVHDDQLGTPTEPRMYLLHGQWPERRFVFVIRSQRDAPALAAEARRAIAAVDPGVPILSIRTLDGMVAESLQMHRLAFASAWAIGLLALGLAVLGVYGVIAHLTAVRTQEIGIRIALGASEGRIVHLVLRDALTMIVPGVVLGILIDVAATNVLLSLIFGIGPLDPPSFAAAPLLVGAAALLAAYQPARRAMRVDPMAVIRGSP